LVAVNDNYVNPQRVRVTEAQTLFCIVEIL
jgi:hypothetical protein